MNRFRGAALLVAGIALGALAVEAVHFARAPDDDDAARAGSAAAPAAAGLLRLDPAVERQAGLRLAVLASAGIAQGRAGYARALDLSPLAAIASEASAASGAADASARELARLVALHQADAGAALKDVEAARAQAGADRARLTLACQRVALEYGPGLARLGCAALPALARAAASGQLAVLRLDFPGVAPLAGATAAIDLAPGAATVTVLGPAAAGDSQLQTSGAIALLRGPLAARAGTGRIMAARAAGGPSASGVMVPRQAIVRTEGGLFAWRAAAPQAYERVPLAGAVAAPDGWIVPGGRLNPGDRIVVDGAGTLLGLEHAAPAAAPADD